MYEFVYTSIGQMIAAYAPNAVFAALVNPVLIVQLVSFYGVMVPYSQITSFWRYWAYYIDPFNYLMSALLVFTTWDAEVTCKPEELAIFDSAPNQTCGQYLQAYQQGMGAGIALLNAGATADCQVCQYASGAAYLQGFNIKEKYYGWRNAGIVVIFAFSSYAFVYLLMKLRTKATKRAE